MSSACLDKMIIEDEVELAPKIKRMKLNSEFSPGKEIKRPLMNADPKVQLKSVYPYFSEDVTLIY